MRACTIVFVHVLLRVLEIGFWMGVWRGLAVSYILRPMCLNLTPYGGDAGG